MKTADLQEKKLNLITWISQLTDADLIESLHQIKNSNKGQDWWDTLTDSQKKVLEAGLRDVNDQKVLTSSQFWSALTHVEE